MISLLRRVLNGRGCHRDCEVQMTLQLATTGQLHLQATQRGSAVNIDIRQYFRVALNAPPMSGSEN